MHQKPKFRQNENQAYLRPGNKSLVVNSLPAEFVYPNKLFVYASKTEIPAK
jgi:hypothetical protein